MTQVVNDQMIDELRASFFHKRREVWCLDNNDVKPNNDGMGLAKRFINPTGLTTWTSHFRTGDVAGAGELAAYSWINDGTFTGAPAATTYSLSGDFLNCATAGASRHFLARSITNAAASWQGKRMFGRFRTGINTEMGLRFDTGADGTANEFYVEAIVQAIAGSGGSRYDVALRYRINAAAVVTQLCGLNIYAGDLTTFYLLSYWSGVVLTGNLYVLCESASISNTGFTSAALTAYYPQVGRSGIYLGAGAVGNRADCDWFYNELV